MAYFEFYGTFYTNFCFRNKKSDFLALFGHNFKLRDDIEKQKIPFLEQSVYMNKNETGENLIMLIIRYDVPKKNHQKLSFLPFSSKL